MPATSFRHVLAQTDLGSIEWLRTNGVRIGLVILLAVALSRIGTVAIRRMRRRLEGAPSLTGALNLQRTTTVAGILTSAVRVVIWTLVVLLVLSQVGLDVAPLIAGAGIIGVALGFGAQSLVKDFLSGFFIILENQFGVGDTVEIVTDQTNVSVTGKVEALTLRTTSVRGGDGALYITPNGNVHLVANRSRGQARVTVEVQVPRGEDPEEIRRLLTELCDELRRDPVFESKLFSGPDVIAVEPQGDVMLVKVGADTRPARADGVREELERRITRRFLSVPHDVVVGSDR